jgi:hypothetical protein
MILNDLVDRPGAGAAKKGGIKNTDKFHDVIENKQRENGHFDLCHDVHENKQLILIVPRC